MLKSPSSRRKSANGPVTLNLVPILDALVTLIAFLLFTMSFLSIVSIESPFPQASAKSMEEKIKEKPLQLTVTVREKETEIWTPFEKFAAKTIANAPDGNPDIKAIHETLMGIKQQFPKETHVVIVPYAGANYDILITVMDTMRTIEPTDPPLFIKNAATGIDEPQKLLFPDVVFGNLLGDS